MPFNSINEGTGARAKAWCFLIHAEASLSLSLSLSLEKRRLETLAGVVAGPKNLTMCRMPLQARMSPSAKAFVTLCHAVA
jgi:hypothetical protein